MRHAALGEKWRPPPCAIIRSCRAAAVEAVPAWWMGGQALGLTRAPCRSGGDRAVIATYIQNSLDNDFIGNVIDVCPLCALTDNTFRFKTRVCFTKPMDAHRDCPNCSGKVQLWMRGPEVFRVTARKDEWGEV